MYFSFIFCLLEEGDGREVSQSVAEVKKKDKKVGREAY